MLLRRAMPNAEAGVRVCVFVSTVADRGFFRPHPQSNSNQLRTVAIDKPSWLIHLIAEFETPSPRPDLVFGQHDGLI